MKTKKKIKPDTVKYYHTDIETGELIKSHANEGSIDAAGKKPSSKKLSDCNSPICRLIRLMRTLEYAENYVNITTKYNEVYNERISKYTIGKLLSRMLGYGYVVRRPSNAGPALYKLVERLEYCKCEGAA